MNIFSTSEFKKTNIKLLMKQEQIKVALSRLFNSNKVKWNNIDNEKNSRNIHITNVILSKDYNAAKIYVNLYSYLSEINCSIVKIVKDLNEETVILKKFLSRELKFRKVPRLLFKVDENCSKVRKIEDILDNLKYPSKDNQLNEEN